MSSRRGAYAVLGALLSLGAPFGLLAVRLLVSGELSTARIWVELSADRMTYGYVSLSTLLAFTAFGFVLGRQADRLIEISSEDPLTGLHNRRALAERLRLELTRAARYQEPLSLLLIDVDGLKTVNDRGGHGAGDAALGVVASAIRAGSRASDLSARWGGDEFALLAPNTGSDAAVALAERIRKLVANGPGPAGDLRVTISVGCSTALGGAPAASVDGLVQGADAALYDAKRSGRNCVVARSWAETEQTASR